MNVTTIAQLVSAATNLIFVLVIAVGYYMMIKLYRRMVAVYDRMLHVTEAQRTAMGRPQVIVDDDYARLPEVDLVVRNVSEGAAKEITFEFSSPVESSDGTVVSELSYFRDGLDFLAPGDEISCYWDHLDSLLPLLKGKGLEGDRRDHQVQGPGRGVLPDPVEAQPLPLPRWPLRAAQGRSGCRPELGDSLR